TSATVPAAYRITSSDNTTALRQAKAYKWLIDFQIAALMPAARPTPNSGDGSSLAYWKDYINAINSNSGKLGYRTYVSWVMDLGRDETGSVSGAHGQLSYLSANCPYHNETVGTSSYSFPPSEQPTHSERRSVIAGLQEVKSKNSVI